MQRDDARSPSSTYRISRRGLLKAGLLTAASASLFRLPHANAAPNALGFCPISGGTGDVIKLFGPDLGTHAADISAVICGSPYCAFSLPISINDGELSTLITAVPKLMQPAPFLVSVGTGYYDSPGNMPSELSLDGPIYSWTGDGSNRYQSYQNFSFPMAGGQANCFWGGLSGGALKGSMVIPFDDDCCPIVPAGTRLTLRLFAATNNHALEMGYQVNLITQTPLYPEHVGDALCTVFQSAFASNFGMNPICTFQVNYDHEVCIEIREENMIPFVVGGIHLSLSDGADSISGDSVVCDSTSCDSIGPDCDSITVDFDPFTFS